MYYIGNRKKNERSINYHEISVLSRGTCNQRNICLVHTLVMARTGHLPASSVTHTHSIGPNKLIIITWTMVDDGFSFTIDALWLSSLFSPFLDSFHIHIHFYHFFFLFILLFIFKLIGIRVLFLVNSCYPDKIVLCRKIDKRLAIMPFRLIALIANRNVRLCSFDDDDAIDNSHSLTQTKKKTKRNSNNKGKERKKNEYKNKNY